VVTNNLVLASGDGIRVLSKPERASQAWVDGNTVGAGRPLSGGFRSNNHAYSFPQGGDLLAEWAQSSPGREWLRTRAMPLHQEAGRALDALTAELSWPGGSAPALEGPSWEALTEKLRRVETNGAGGTPAAHE
jgi:hypothetical protein